MKTNKSFLWALIVGAMFSFTSCDSTDDDDIFGGDDIEDGGNNNGGDEIKSQGTLESPFSVKEAIAVYSSTTANKTGLWTKGYIVGYNTGGDTFGDLATYTPVLGTQTEYFSDLNIYIADNASETNAENCIIVQLTTTVRAALGLKTNPTNFGEEILVKGDFERYFSTQGIKNTSNYRIKGEGPEENPGEGETENSGTFESPFTSADVIALNPQSTSDAVKKDVWAKGYIVGYKMAENVDGVEKKDYLGKQDSYHSDHNIYIADNASETDLTKCISIQITADYRGILGLKTTPSNFGKEVMIKGDVLKYNSIAGIKNPSDYRIDGKGPVEIGRASCRERVLRLV